MKTYTVTLIIETNSDPKEWDWHYVMSIDRNESVILASVEEGNLTEQAKKINSLEKRLWNVEQKVFYHTHE